MQVNSACSVKFQRNDKMHDALTHNFNRLDDKPKVDWTNLRDPRQGKRAWGIQNLHFWHKQCNVGDQRPHQIRLKMIHAGRVNFRGVLDRYDSVGACKI